MNVISDQSCRNGVRYLARWARWVPVWTREWQEARRYAGTDAAGDLAKLRECGHPGKLVSIRQLERGEK